MTDDRDRDQAPHDEPDPLLEELRRIASIVDPVPQRTIEAGQTAFAWRTFDAEFAALVHDSLAVAAPAGVRGEEPPLLLTFESEDLLVEVKITRVGAERTLVGQLSAADDEPPSQVAGVEVVAEHANGPTTVESDQRGRFVATGIAAGPVRLRCRPLRPAPEVVTDWVTL